MALISRTVLGAGRGRLRRGAPLQAPEPLPRGRPGTRGWAVAAIVSVVALLLGVALFLWLDGWHVNSDGSGYLSIGFNLRRGQGWRLPDGSPAPSLRGPLYPILLALPWVSGVSLAASIWASRVPMILAPAIIGWLVGRGTGSLLAAVVATVVALVHPWTLIAGGEQFVPDGLAAACTVAAVAAAVVAARSPRRRWWLAGAAIAALAAVATKETGGLAFALAAIAYLHARRPFRPLVAGASLAALAVAEFVLLVAVGGNTDVPISGLPWVFQDRVRHELFGGTWLWVPVAAVLGLVALWAVRHVGQPLVLAGLVLVTTGMVLGVYAAGRHFGLRNAALLPYGLALLLGALVGGRRDLGAGLGPRRWPATVAALVLAAVVVVPMAAATQRHSARSAKNPGWDNAAALDAAAWLGAHANGQQVSCSLLFCSQVWLENRGDLDVSLIPQYGARLGPRTVAQIHFTERTNWSGRRLEGPEAPGAMLVLTRSDDLFGAVFEGPLLRELDRSGARYLVITGNAAGTRTFEAGFLVPYLESHPGFHRVFATDADLLPLYTIVYEVAGSLEPHPDPHLVVSIAAQRRLPADAAVAQAQAYQGESYRAMLRPVLRR